MKSCKFCGIKKDLSEFYTHPETADGHLGVCKACKKRYSKLHAQTKNGKMSERRRNAKPVRKAKVAATSKAWQMRNPEKRRAHIILNNAVRDGLVFRPDRCERCGNAGKVHAHHDDYSKPLEVEWLCVPCHGTEHPNFIPL